MDPGVSPPSSLQSGSQVLPSVAPGARLQRGAAPCRCGSAEPAYFIKGGSDSPLSFVLANGDTWTGGGGIIPPLPAPGAITLLALAGLTGSQRRRGGLSAKQAAQLRNTSVVE